MPSQNAHRAARVSSALDECVVRPDADGNRDVVLADEGGRQAESLEIVRIQRRVVVSCGQLVERLRPGLPRVRVPAPLERIAHPHVPLLPHHRCRRDGHHMTDRRPG